MPKECGICHAEGEGRWYTGREMMFGFRDRFSYFECPECGCLQLSQIPADMSRYYPAEYYSLELDPSRRGRIESLVRNVRNRYAFFREGLLGRVLAAELPYSMGSIHHWLSLDGLSRDSRILDVGCGGGQLLYDLASLGYRRLLGVDPFIREDIEYGNGVRILRSTIHELDGSFDLVMFHHSLEHIPDQLETMQSAARLLAPGGYCLVRIPIVSSYAWEHYRENWVQLDAPRHFFLHSVESIRRLGESAGLRLARTWHDSTELQFVGSELYARDIPLREGGGKFGRREVREFRRRAAELNAQGRGDQAAFLFTPAGGDG